MDQYDDEVLAELDSIYRSAIQNLNRQIQGYADSTGTLRLDVLNKLLAQANQQLAQLTEQRNALLNTGLNTGAAVAVSVFAEDAGKISGSLSNIADDAVRFVRNFIAEDGLQLSDRIWRIDNHTKTIITDAIQQAVIHGHSASQAAADLLARGLPVTPEINTKTQQANPKNIETAINEGIFRKQGNPYDNAKRLMRTEINRAHGEAYQAAAFAHEDVIGTQFLLGKGHPRPDICDMHANANVYGLGKGVYPKGQNPWPAHPNTLSYVVAVFSDEVTDDDKKGKQSRIDWLKQKPISEQESVLNSVKKRQALDRGLLKESEINTPWAVLKKKYEKKGYKPDEWN